jgi:hypothetical protein
VPLPSSPAPTEETPVEGVSKLAVRLADVETTTLTVELGPDAAPGGDSVALSEWSVDGTFGPE